MEFLQLVVARRKGQFVESRILEVPMDQVLESYLSDKEEGWEITSAQLVSKIRTDFTNIPLSIMIKEKWESEEIRRD